ncbi:MAG: hypothetical protein WKF37_13290 [Bryobacteraceae bacterium]
MSSFSSDLISLSAGAGVVLRQIGASPEVGEARIADLRAEYSGGSAGNSQRLAAALLFRGFAGNSAHV